MKKKRMVTALAAATALAAVVPAIALAADSASGSVNFNGGTERLTFAVIETGDGLGSITYKNITAGFSYTAHVNCVEIDGDTATFSYVIPGDRRVPEGIRGLPISFTVVDDAPDEIGYVVDDECAVAPTAPITGGSLTVLGEEDEEQES